MEYVFGTLSLLLPVLDLIRKGKRSIRDMKQLLQNESDMEKLVFSLKKLLDGLKGVSFDEDIPELHKDLYISLEKKNVRVYTMR